MRLIKGQAAAEEIKQNATARAAELNGKGIFPSLAVIRFGSRPDDVSYQKGIEKRCGEAGAAVRVSEFDENIGHDAFMEQFKRINNDAAVHGIIILRPFPDTVDESVVTKAIDPAKDVDGMSDENLVGVFRGSEDCFAPCTAEAVIRLLEYEGIQLAGKKAVIIGRSLVVGKPLAMMLLSKDATVTICHSKTQDIRSISAEADILVCAAGRPGMVDCGFVKKGAVVIDVGINVDKDGRLCGDVDAESVKKYAAMLTPVPGGVGSVTSWLLVEHVIRAAEKRS